MTTQSLHPSMGGGYPRFKGEIPVGAAARAPVQTVTDLETVRLLTDLEELRHLAPLMGRELTASQYAEAAQAPLNKAYYRLKRLVRQGLAEVCRQTPRAGRAVKHYRSVAERFCVPMSLVGEAGLEALIERSSAFFEPVVLRQSAQALYGLLERMGEVELEIGGSAAEGLRMGYRHASGRPVDWLSLLNHPETSAVFNTVSVLALPFEEAKNLQRELCDLLLKYSGKTGPAPWVFRVNLVPFQER